MNMKNILRQLQINLEIAMTWVERKVIDYKIENLPFDDEEKLALIDPSRVRIEVPGIVYPVDIGAWCYTKRKRRTNNIRSESFSIIDVKVDSFRSQRREFVVWYLGYLYHLFKIGRAEDTLEHSISQLTQLVKWADANKPYGLDKKENIKETVTEYSEQLMHRVRVIELSINTAAMKQYNVMSACLHIYGDETGSLFGGVRIIRKSSASTNITEPPSEERAAKYISIYNAIFLQLTDFVVNKGLYPMVLNLPHGNYSGFPKDTPFIKQDEWKKDQDLQRRFFAYNYEECRLHSEDEIFKKINKENPSKRYAKDILCTAKVLIAEANRDHFHKRRILLATLASQAFMMMFSANTAMSLSLISDIKWSDDDFTTVKGVQGFRTIKYRAGNKEVSFMVGTSFVRFLTKYLKLRRYLMDAHNRSNYEYLFFRIVRGEVKRLSMNAGYNFNKRLQNLFGMAETDLVGMRQWRAYKSDWLLNNTDLTTTAMVLQNSETTVLKHYAEGSNKNADIELTNFFEKFKESTVIGEETPSSAISIGQCKSQGNPILNAEKIPFEPNCKKPEGCFFVNIMQFMLMRKI